MQAEHRRRALTLESARLIPAGPHTDEAQQRIVTTWRISPEAAPVLGRYQQLEEARLQQLDQAPQRQDRAGSRNRDLTTRSVVPRFVVACRTPNL